MIDHVVPEGLFSDNVSLGVEKPDLEDAVHNEELAFVVRVVLWKLGDEVVVAIVVGHGESFVVVEVL